MADSIQLNLPDLALGLPAITPAFGAALAEAGAICLSSQGHSQGVRLQLVGDWTNTCKLYWQPVTPQMLRCWNDRDYATEQAAYAVALLLMKQVKGFTVVERSRRGTGFDYWLGHQATDELLLQKLVRLEVSGIRQGTLPQVKARVKLKTEQLKSSAQPLPAYVVVVEFSQPLTWVKQR